MGRKQKVNFEKLEESDEIPMKRIVRVTQMNDIIEILSLAKEPEALLNFRKLNKTQYMNLETGEVLNYILTENRGQNIAGLKKTFKIMRNLINNNFTGASNELFVTLSYAENMTDTTVLMKDFDTFMKRFKRKYSNTDYISIVEPQGRGAWHCHVLIRFNDLDKIYIANNDVLAPMWGHGFTKVKSLKNVDNIGAYLNAYLSDVECTDENSETIFSAMMANQSDILELEDGKKIDLNKGNYTDLKVVEKDVLDDNGKMVKKKFVKGARLHMYPSGMNLYRCSRGIKKPDTVKMPYSDAKKIVGSRPANYSRTINLTTDDDMFINQITYEQYNLKREKCKESIKKENPTSKSFVGLSKANLMGLSEDAERFLNSRHESVTKENQEAIAKSKEEMANLKRKQDLRYELDPEYRRSIDMLHKIELRQIEYEIDLENPFLN